MKSGRPSCTAELVCMGRAVAHVVAADAGFADPTALALLPSGARIRVQRARGDVPPRNPLARLDRARLRRWATVMAARTLAIDGAFRDAPPEQVVILGAGLDGRAWRMPELHESVVFEADFPDSQRAKQARAGTLAQTAREVRFVPVDLEHDTLDDALEKAGHDPARATTWLCEGVLMYLTPAAIAATFAVIGQRSAAGSRLVSAYHSPGLRLRFFGLISRLMGEPLRSDLTAVAMRGLLERHGFAVVSDGDIHAVVATMPAKLSQAAKFAPLLRIAVAYRNR